jgi:GTP-binding protein Era
MVGGGRIMTFKCGFVALIGQPNAGKSTLLNQILGSKLAITSAKPQTTRHRIAGIHNTDASQIILVDTPGIHDAWTALNQSMVRRSLEAIKEVDAVCWLLDTVEYAARYESRNAMFREIDEQILKTLAGSGRPVIMVFNKMDVVPKPLVLPVIDAFSKRLDSVAIVPISALTGDGKDALVAEVESVLPEHPPLYPKDEWAQVSERFLVSEVIREKIFHLTEQEIPYSAFVEVERFDESERETRSFVRINAKISVERKSQKGIVIGKGGEMLKRIGTMARKEIQTLLGCKVHLELFVNVERDWSKTKKGLRKVGYEGR